MACAIDVFLPQPFWHHALAVSSVHHSAAWHISTGKDKQVQLLPGKEKQVQLLPVSSWTCFSLRSVFRTMALTARPGPEQRS